MISPFKTLVASALVLAGHAGAALYQQNFTTDDTANWAMKSGPTTPVPVDAAANFFFDYSIVGIPSAPNGTGTTGMKLQANLSAGVFVGMSVSPTNVSLPSVYTLTFDWWSNSVGPFPAGGSGSTNLSTFGVGTTGANAQWPGGAVDSVYFGATGDGGSSSDVRAYSSAAPSSYADPIRSTSEPRQGIIPTPFIPLSARWLPRQRRQLFTPAKRATSPLEPWLLRGTRSPSISPPA
jgi:hypothetical protein